MKNENQCIICFEESYLYDKLAQFTHNCGSYMTHKQCLYLWFIRNRNECIICRTELIGDDFTLIEDGEIINFELPLREHIMLNIHPLQRNNLLNFFRHRLYVCTIKIAISILIIFICIFECMIFIKTLNLFIDFKENIFILIIPCLVIFLASFIHQIELN